MLSAHHQHSKMAVQYDVFITHIHSQLLEYFISSVCKDKNKRQSIPPHALSKVSDLPYSMHHAPQQELTLYVPIDVPVSNTYAIPKPLPHRANAQEKVQYIFRVVLVPSANVFLSGQVTLRNVSDEVLLKIFRYYLDAFARFWPKLVHVCRKWRQIVFASQRSLRLRLFCTHGTPVLKTLDCWPALPIALHYGGAQALDPPTPKDEDNIMAAMKYPDRVSSISLTVTNSLLEKLSVTERRFLELEDLVLLSQGSVRLTLPNAFRWGVRLRTLHLTGVAISLHLTGSAISALPEILSPSTGLVDLQIHKIPEYFSPEAFANALSGMTQLRTLSLHFLSLAPHLFTLDSRLRSRVRVVLPALARLEYRGTSMYLDSLVARVDAPRLGDVDITFFCHHKMGAWKLRRFINRIEMQKSHSRAEILSSEHAISISFTQPETPTRLKLQVPCKTLALQSSFMVPIFNSLSAFLLGVEHLRIGSTLPSSRKNHNDHQQWLKLINPFRGTKWVHVAGDSDHSTSIVLALHLRQREAVLPALHKLCVRGPDPPSAPLQERVVSFIHSRRLLGQMVGVEYERVRINELRGTGTTFV